MIVPAIFIVDNDNRRYGRIIERSMAHLGVLVFTAKNGIVDAVSDRDLLSRRLYSVILETRPHRVTKQAAWT
jgi:hypothetical protein